MSDFDKIKVGDWVRVEAHFGKSGVCLPHTLTYEGFVVEKGSDSDSDLIRLSTKQSGWGVWIGVTTSPVVESVRLLEHRPSREVGWHEVVRPGACVAVRWWDGDKWRHSPTGPATAVDYGRSEHYLGTGSM